VTSSPNRSTGADRPDRPITAADVLDAADVAALVGVHRATVLDWASAGTIPSRKRGRRVLFIRWEIEAWLLADPRGLAA
jgi:excisionase family DNA binding protein